MVYGGIISILIAIWIYRTAMDNKTSKALYWVAGSVIVFLAMQSAMIYFNAFIIESYETDFNIGILFEIGTWFVPLFVIAVLRQMVMLKQSFSFMGLFSGIIEMFIAIKDSFKTS